MPFHTFFKPNMLPAGQQPAIESTATTMTVSLSAAKRWYSQRGLVSLEWAVTSRGVFKSKALSACADAETIRDVKPDTGYTLRLVDPFWSNKVLWSGAARTSKVSVAMVPEVRDHEVFTFDVAAVAETAVPDIG